MKERENIRERQERREVMRGIKTLMAIIPNELKNEFRTFLEDPEPNPKIIIGIFRARGYEDEIKAFLRENGYNY